VCPRERLALPNALEQLQDERQIRNVEYPRLCKDAGVIERRRIRTGNGEAQIQEVELQASLRFQIAEQICGAGWRTGR
jgi:hypothetical protein